VKKCGCGSFNHWYNISLTHLHALLGVGEIHEGGLRVCRPPVKWSVVAESVRNTGLYAV
jgi:hypothetical protein